MIRFLICTTALVVATQAAAAAVALRPNCFITPEGCSCNVKEGLEETVRSYYSVDDCKKPVEVQTAENKNKLNAEIKAKFGAFKENCFPKPSGGCKCNVDEGQGETVREYSEDADCKVSLEAQTANNKKELNQEIKEKFGNFKENCFPKPSGGCKCTEKDSNGNEVVLTYNSAEQCSVRSKREVNVGNDRTINSQVQYDKTRARSQSPDNLPSQNVRDPVRERAQANYRAVVEELNNKFKGLKEGCFPRPKGCLCVVGKTAEGRDITERRMKDADCKCKDGEKGPGCPAA
ncbi:unnamed protein product [Auanema sp. JU1783]|nr:unnamed protein product [Auanema sp. JU1783]